MVFVWPGTGMTYKNQRWALAVPKLDGRAVSVYNEKSVFRTGAVYSNVLEPSITGWNTKWTANGKGPSAKGFSE